MGCNLGGCNSEMWCTVVRRHSKFPGYVISERQMLSPEIITYANPQNTHTHNSLCRQEWHRQDSLKQLYWLKSEMNNETTFHKVFNNPMNPKIDLTFCPVDFRKNRFFQCDYTKTNISPLNDYVMLRKTTFTLLHQSISRRAFVTGQTCCIH